MIVRHVIMATDVRAVISPKLYNQIKQKVDLPINVGLNKSLIVLLDKYEKLEKFYKQNVGRSKNV